jgi:hypothetical protein
MPRKEGRAPRKDERTLKKEGRMSRMDTKEEYRERIPKEELALKKEGRMGSHEESNKEKQTM